MIGRVLTFIIMAVILVNIMYYVLPVTFNQSAMTSFTVWGTSYLWWIGLVAIIVVFGGLLIFWNDAKRLMGSA